VGSKKSEVGRTSSIPNGRHFHQLIAYGFDEVHRDRSIPPHDAWKTIAQSLRISDRELQIIKGIFDDPKEFAIADELTISVHTIHTHLERLYRKLGVSSRVGLVLSILSEYLSSLPPTL
jgi:ATP/maltotriose-dependent transcriptional regulator MalT